MRHTRSTSLAVTAATLLATTTFTAALSVASGSTAEAATSGNLLVNPSYASGRTGWAGDSNTTFTTATNGWNGSYGANLTPVAAGRVSLTDSPDAVAYTYAGATYTATVRVKNPTAGTTVNGAVALTEIAPASPTPLAASTPFALSDTAWHTVTVAGVAAGNVVGAPGGHGLSVAVTGYGLPLGRLLLVDDWTLVRDPNLPPTPSFTAASTYLTARFDASASTDSDGTVASYAWDFGDGTTGTGRTPSHAYATAGTKTVTLTVTDDDGATATTTRTLTVVANVAPTAAFTSTTSYLTARLDASGSADTDGTLASYAWTFGDGTTGTTRLPSHTYAAAGTYPVTLTVTDNGGKTATTTRQVTVVANVAPGAAFTSTTSYLKATFDASESNDTDGSIARYTWDFGDGAVGAGRVTSHTYGAAGTYDVALTVSDNAGAMSVRMDQVSVVADVPPTAGIVSSSKYLTAKLNATTSVDTDGTITGYAWTFGDGTSAVGKWVTHTYDTAGTYTATLTVTDDGGATDTESVQVTVVANVLPTASFSSTTSYLTARLDASTSTDTDGTIKSWDWTFGDGTTATGKVVSHTWLAGGGKSVTLTVTDDYGATDTKTLQVRVVANVLPTASFTNAGSYRTARFDATASADTDGTLTTYRWDFGDGTTGTGVYASRVYPTPGTRTVTLTVTDDYGSTATYSRTVTTTASPAVKLGVYNGLPNERPDESTLASFGRYPQVASTYYQPTSGINMTYETARINRGTSPNLTKTTAGTQYLAGIANGDPAALTWLNTYVNQLKQLAAVNPNLPIYATLEHEFKVKVRNGIVTGPSADPLVYAKALSVFIAKVHAAAPNIKATYWMVGFDRAFEGQIGAALTQRPDVVTFDPYADVAGDTIASIAGPDVSWLRAQAWYDDQPIAMSEFGMPVFNGDAALAAYYTDVRSQIDALGISWAVLFDRAKDNNHEIATPTNDYPLAVRAFSRSLAS